jgi:hypothetical protein
MVRCMKRGVVTNGTNGIGFNFTGPYNPATNYNPYDVATYTYTLSPHLFGIAFDGTNIWVSNSTAATVTKLLASTGATLGTYTVGNTPG